MTDELRRPPGVTMACFAAGLVAFFVVTDTITVLSDWGSLELQEAVQSGLEAGGLVDQGISLATAMSFLRIGFYIVTVLCIAMTVFAVYAARGDRPSRLGLTVLCALAGGTLTLMGGGLFALLPAVVLLAACFILWTPEARVWYDLKNGRTPSPELIARARERQQAVNRTTSSARSADVDALTGRGTPPDHQHQPPVGGVVPPPPPGVFPHGQMPPGPEGHRWLAVAPRTKPPGLLTGAAITMIVGSAITACFAGLIALLYVMRATDPVGFAELAGDEQLLPEVLYDLPGDDRTVAITVAVLLLITVLAGLAILLGVALLMQNTKAYVPSLIFCAIGVFGSAAAIPVSMPVMAAATVSLVLLRLPRVRAWAGRDRRQR